MMINPGRLLNPAAADAFLALWRETAGAFRHESGLDRGLASKFVIDPRGRVPKQSE